MCNQIDQAPSPLPLRSDIRNEILGTSLFPVKDLSASKVGKDGVGPVKGNERRRRERENTDRSSTCNAYQNKKYRKRKRKEKKERDTLGQVKLERLIQGLVIYKRTGCLIRYTQISTRCSS